MVIEKFFVKPCLRRLLVFANHCSKVNHSSVATSVKVKPSILLSKTNALVDEEVCITVSGLQKGQKVTLQMHVDEGSKSFGACGHYVADENGKFNTMEHESNGGTFKGLEPMGLFWSMQTLPGLQPRRFINTNVSQPIDIKISLHPNHVDFKDMTWTGGHSPLVSCNFSQWYMNPKVKIIPVDEDGVFGTLYLPEGEGPFPGVIDVFGITSVSPGHRSSLLASKGIASFNLTYIGIRGTAQSTEGIDYTYFLRAFDWLSRHPSINPKALGGIGSCIGAAYLSIIVWKRPNLRCYVSINSPTRPEGPTQMVEGELVENVVPWLWHLREEIEGALSWRPMGRVEDNVPSLPYWRHGAKVLQIQGEDDRCVNPDCLRASHKVIPQQFMDNVKFISYPGAGHILEPSNIPLCQKNYNAIFKTMMLWGGQPKQHAHAQADCWPKIIEFFKKNLKEGSYSDTIRGV